MLPKFAYIRPESMSEALEQLASDEAYVFAGGTDLLGCLRDGVFEAPKVVSLSGHRSGRGGGVSGEPAAPQPGHRRRQPLPAAALLVFPWRVPLPEEGR